MDETVLKVAIAGFLHDAGKLVDEKVLKISNSYLENNAELYQPFHQGHYTHRHAVLTAALIEHCEALLPSCLNKRNWGLADSFVNLAAGHHNPQTPMQWIIAVADRVSSGWDRAKFEEEYNRAVAVQDYQKTRLLPIFENLLKNTGSKSDGMTHAYGYPLKPVSPLTIFPEAIDRVKPSQKEGAAAEYENLFSCFLGDLGSLLHKEENLSLWFEHLESLVMIYAAAVPAARAGRVIPDVSLFDHMKATSALSVALYIYHRDTDSLNIDAVQDYDPKKFLLVTGDFYGIQNFIFSGSTETGGNRSKILRGRSFAVSLLSELAADVLCRELGLPSICIVLNAAGKFTLIAPNTSAAREKILSTDQQLNAWLIKTFNGENSIGISFVEASPNDFVGGRFSALWDHLAQQNEKRKYQKFDIEVHGGTVSDYLDSFRNDLRHPLCPFCGKRPSSPKTEGDPLVGEDSSCCTICRDHILFGTYLVKRNRVAVTTPDADLYGHEKLTVPLYGRYQVAFVDGEMKGLARSGKLLKYWNLTIEDDGRVPCEVTARFVNGYVPVYGPEDFHDERLLAGKKTDRSKEERIDLMQEGVPKTFAHLANKALNFKPEGEGFCGIEALGVLKADVDHLGLLMICGLDESLFTLSRLATLSRQLNWFFALYLPYQLKHDARFTDVYTVFAGGDDLFLIGPWNRIIDLAGFIHEAFSRYVCRNPEVHLSAGISLHKPNTPLQQLAEDAEAALSRSKNEGRNRLNLFGETVTWDEFFQLRKIKDRLETWTENGLINNAMIYRLNDFTGMAKLEETVLKSAEIYVDDMECLKWRAFFCYTAERNIGRGLGKADRESRRKEMLDEFVSAAEWLDKYRGKLKIALWDVIYNRR